MKCIGGRREVQSQGGRRGGVFSRAVHGIVRRSCFEIPWGGGDSPPYADRPWNIVLLGGNTTFFKITPLLPLVERNICFIFGERIICFF